jgi:hypothetical protein
MATERQEGMLPALVCTCGWTGRDWPDAKAHIIDGIARGEAHSVERRELGKSLENAMLDAINALPPQERPAMCERVRDAMTNQPAFRIVDGEAELWT